MPCSANPPTHTADNVVKTVNDMVVLCSRMMLDLAHIDVNATDPMTSVEASGEVAFVGDVAGDGDVPQGLEHVKNPLLAHDIVAAQAQIHAGNVRGLSFGCGDLGSWTRVSPMAQHLVTTALARGPTSEHKVKQSEVRVAINELAGALLEIPGMVTESAHKVVYPRSKRTCLHRAAANGCLSCAEILLTGGSDPDAKDVSNRYPSHVAAAAGFATLARRLAKARGHEDELGYSLGPEKDAYGQTVGSLLQMVEARPQDKPTVKKRGQDKVSGLDRANPTSRA